MSDNDSDIDAIMAQADDDASADADSGDEEASQDSIDALFGDAADDGDGLPIDEILGEGGSDVAEQSVEAGMNPLLIKFEDRAVKDVKIELPVVLG